MRILQQLKKTVGGSLRTVVTVVVVLVVVIPAAAWAGHQFDDVPDGHVFHDAIDWMRDNGVTAGCNPPANDRYCPDDFVTRGQMAAFMFRLDNKGVFLPKDGKAANADQLDGKDSSAFAAADHRHTALFSTATREVGLATSSTTYEDIADMTTQVTIPPGHTGVIVATFNSEVQCRTSGADADCGVRIVVDGTEIGPSVAPIFDGTADGPGIESHSIQRISSDLGPGTYTVKAQFKVGHADVSIGLFNSSLFAEVKLTS